MPILPNFFETVAINTHTIILFGLGKIFCSRLRIAKDVPN